MQPHANHKNEPKHDGNELEGEDHDVTRRLIQLALMLAPSDAHCANTHTKVCAHAPNYTQNVRNRKCRRDWKYQKYLLLLSSTIKRSRVVHADMCTTDLHRVCIEESANLASIQILECDLDEAKEPQVRVVCDKVGSQPGSAWINPHVALQEPQAILCYFQWSVPVYPKFLRHRKQQHHVPSVRSLHSVLCKTWLVCKAFQTPSKWRLGHVMVTSK